MSRRQYVYQRSRLSRTPFTLHWYTRFVVFFRRIIYSLLDVESPVPLVPYVLRAPHSVLTDKLGGGATHFFPLSVFKEYVISSSLDNINAYTYRFVDHLPVYSSASYPVENNYVYAKPPLSELVLHLTIPSARVVAQLHDVPASHCKSKQLMASYLQNHHCAVCDTCVTVFLATKSTELSSRRQAKWRQKNQNLPASNSSANVPPTYPPPPLSEDLELRIIRDFCDDVKPSSFEETGCGVCGQLSLRSEMSPLSEIRGLLRVLQDEGVTRAERCSVSDPIRGVDGPVLDPGCSLVCKSCRVSLRKGCKPKNALANGLWVGAVPKELADLHFVERLLVAKVRHNVCYVRVACGQKKMTSHVVCFESPVSKIYEKLPPPREDMDDVLAILFTGPTLPGKADYVRTPLLVRRNKVAAALEWLKLNHTDYSDLEIDSDALSTYPEDVPIVSVQYQQSLTNKVNLTPSVNDDSDEDGVVHGECPFVAHGVSADDLQTKSVEELKGLAMRHFNANGRVLAVDASSKPCSLYHNPQLYPQMFPWLFPYGLGGLGTCSTMSESAHKRHLLLYHDKRFQLDTYFPLVAFSHKQIKSGTTGGFLLAEKKKFDDVVDRFLSVDQATVTLASLANRLASGEKVVPSTDEEKVCFQLIKDLDHVAGGVDGFTTSKKFMRSEIWSLIAYKGAPSWFITFAPSDNFHPICLYFAGTNESYSPDVLGSDERMHLIARNPVAGARFFHYMVQMFIKHVLGVGTNHSGLFGDTSAFYSTVEQQGRLTLHLHLMLWIANALSPQEIKSRLMDPSSEFQKSLIAYLESVHVGEFLGATQSDVEERIDLEAKNPDYCDPSLCLPEAPPFKCSNVACGDSCGDCIAFLAWRSRFNDEFNTIVAKTGIHRCSTNTDDRGNQLVGRSWRGCLNNIWKICKARFPCAVVLFSYVDASGHLFVKKLEPWINMLSPVLTFLLRCNSDVTCLLSGTAVKAVVLYVTNYITKCSLKTHVIFDTIRRMYLQNPQILQGDNDDVRRENVRKLMTKIVNSLSSKMEMGAPIACMYLLGNPDHYTSHRFVCFYWQNFVRDIMSFWDDGSDNRQPEKVVLVKRRGCIVALSPVFDYKYQSSKLALVCLYDWVTRCKREKLTLRKKKKSQSESQQFTATECDVGESFDADECRDHYGGDAGDFDGEPEIMDLTADDGVLPVLPEPSQTSHSFPAGFFQFLPQHPLHDSHGVRVAAEKDSLVPNFLGMTLPRRDRGDREYYCATMLTFFKPWRSGGCLKSQDESWDDAFNRYPFTPHQRMLMDNFQLRYECLDAQDDYHAQLRKGVVPSAAWIDVDDIDENDTLDAGDDVPLNDVELVVGPREKARRLQMSSMRDILARLGWTERLPPSQPFPLVMPDLKEHLNASQWASLVSDARQRVLDTRRSMEKAPCPPFQKDSLRSVQVVVADRAYLEKRCHSPLYRKHVDDISSAFCLNKEQDRAFRIVANHICNPYSEKLRMYIGGMGGTGKSQVLKAILKFFDERHKSHRVVVVAPTGSASALLGGSTYHYMFGIDDFSRENEGGRRTLSKVCSRLEGVDYVFLDFLCCRARTCMLLVIVCAKFETIWKLLLAG